MSSPFSNALLNQVHDVAYGHADPTNPSSNPWAWRFSAAIAVYADVDSLVANNLLSPAELSATVRAAVFCYCYLLQLDWSCCAVAAGHGQLQGRQCDVTQARLSL